MQYNDAALDFILETDWASLPGDVQHQAKRCILDTLGALLAGHQTPVARLMHTFALDQFKGDEASILVQGGRTAAAGAALVNGFANNALDIDDGYRPIKGHPGACILPVILAAGELSPGTSGRPDPACDFDNLPLIRQLGRYRRSGGGGQNPGTGP